MCFKQWIDWMVIDLKENDYKIGEKDICEKYVSSSL